MQFKSQSIMTKKSSHKKLEATDYTASTVEKWRRINSYFLQPRIRSMNSVTYSRQVYFY